MRYIRADDHKRGTIFRIIHRRNRKYIPYHNLSWRKPKKRYSVLTCKGQRFDTEVKTMVITFSLTFVSLVSISSVRTSCIDNTMTSTSYGPGLSLRQRIARTGIHFHSWISALSIWRRFFGTRLPSPSVMFNRVDVWVSGGSVMITHQHPLILTR